MSRSSRVDAELRSAYSSFGKGDVAGARSTLERIRDADDKSALGLLGVCLMRLGEPAAAEQCFDRAIALEKGTHGYLSFDLVFAYLAACRGARAWSSYLQRSEILTDVYGVLGITDASFLGLRGLNPFDVFVDEVIAALDAGCPTPAEGVWQTVAVRIDSEGRAYLKKLFDRCGWTMRMSV
jgi:hypothetical protein